VAPWILQVEDWPVTPPLQPDAVVEGLVRGCYTSVVRFNGLRGVDGEPVASGADVAEAGPSGEAEK
jgi:hypothetical protein